MFIVVFFNHHHKKEGLYMFETLQRYIDQDKPAFIAGMQLAMRICRNRIIACKAINKPEQEYEAMICATEIRLIQVEIGSGRMAIPAFTQEEKDEMRRIA